MRTFVTDLSANVLNARSKTNCDEEEIQRALLQACQTDKPAFFI